MEVPDLLKKMVKLMRYARTTVILSIKFFAITIQNLEAHSIVKAAPTRIVWTTVMFMSILVRILQKTSRAHLPVWSKMQKAMA